ncbi:MAG TPA: hypothetical protein VFJ98_09160 [Mycobacteriales bacterium]|jgi:hypothetical protein|nr:hypothetical protein [Mycobacteriales bacterium]
MTEGSDAGLNARGLRFGNQGANGSPDFARNDRGGVDDHWSRAVGQRCGKCDTELTPRDFVRRRLDGTWVHQACPRATSSSDD